MLTLPQTAEYALRAVCYIAEHEHEGPVPVPAIAASLGAPQNYLSKTLHQLGALGVLRSVRGAQGGYRLGQAADRLTLATIVEPFLVPTEHRCIMGRTRCRDDAPCGAHFRWKAVNDAARAFFAELTVGDLMGSQTPRGPAAERALALQDPELLKGARGSSFPVPQTGP
jgi:Rrf2 family protein